MGTLKVATSIFREVSFVFVIFGGPTNGGMIEGNAFSFVACVDNSGPIVVVSTLESISRSTWVEPVMWVDDFVVILVQSNKLIRYL